MSIQQREELLGAIDTARQAEQAAARRKQAAVAGHRQALDTQVATQQRSRESARAAEQQQAASTRYARLSPSPCLVLSDI